MQIFENLLKNLFDDKTEAHRTESEDSREKPRKWPRETRRIEPVTKKLPAIWNHVERSFYVL